MIGPILSRRTSDSDGSYHPDVEDNAHLSKTVRHWDWSSEDAVSTFQALHMKDLFDKLLLLSSIPLEVPIGFPPRTKITRISS
jgi:hypothetical protein